MLRYIAIVLGILWVLAPRPSDAQVTASLVAADQSVKPGQPLKVALRLEHAPGWHTFWINAGIGLPTTIDWQLPRGWSAGSIDWPTPIVIRDPHGAVSGNGYDGITYLPLVISPPADTTIANVTLNAHARWLMCREQCIPSERDLSLSLPVTRSPPRANDPVRKALSELPMPRAPAGWQASAERDKNVVRLRITAADHLKSPHFFSEDGFVAYDGNQSIATTDRGLTLTLPIAEDADEATGRLVGVLAYTGDDGRYRGTRLDIALGHGEGGGTPEQGGNHVSARAASDAAASNRSGSVAVDPSSNLLLTLLFAVLGGAVLNLMPCVFPVLGLKVLGFVNQTGEDRRKTVLHGLVFSSGVLVSFWALAATLAALRAGGEELGWGFQLQSAPFVFALGAVMLVFALNLSGVFEVGMSLSGVGSSLQTRSGHAGTFFAGVLATVVAAPCSAPFLATALGRALTLPVDQSFLVFTAIALGLSFPYLLLSAFPGVVRRLPRPGRWMLTFKQFMAFPLYATVVFLVWVLDGQVGENELLMALLGLTLVAMSAWVYGRYPWGLVNGSGSRLGTISAAVLLVTGVLLGWPRPAAPEDLVWEKWSTERVEQLRREERFVYVDFTARWCATCQANKKVVFGSREVRRYFREHHIVLLKADWTHNDPLITAELARWQRAAIPLNLVYLPHREAPKILPEVITPGMVLAAFQGWSEQRGPTGVDLR